MGGRDPRRGDAAHNPPSMTCSTSRRSSLGRRCWSATRSDVRKLVEGIVERLANGTGERDVQLSMDLADGLTVSADGPKLERAVENLIGNARKYTPQGGEIRVRSSVAEGSLRIEVHELRGRHGRG